MALIHYVVCSDFGEGKKGAVKAAAWLRKKYNIKRRTRFVQLYTDRTMLGEL